MARTCVIASACMLMPFLWKSRDCKQLYEEQGERVRPTFNAHKVKHPVPFSHLERDYFRENMENLVPKCSFA
jgi:hypothetical protein